MEAPYGCHGARGSRGKTLPDTDELQFPGLVVQWRTVPTGITKPRYLSAATALAHTLLTLLRTHMLVRYRSVQRRPRKHGEARSAELPALDARHARQGRPARRAAETAGTRVAGGCSLAHLCQSPCGGLSTEGAQVYTEIADGITAAQLFGQHTGYTYDDFIMLPGAPVFVTRARPRARVGPLTLMPPARLHPLPGRRG